MKPEKILVSGFTFVRNAVKYDFPIKESILSLLPIVDEYIVVVVDSEDETLEVVESIRSSKIRIFKERWIGYKKGSLAYYTEIALKKCRGIWCFYLQADEVLHEKYHDYIKEALIYFKDAKSVEGFTLRYKHFWGNYYLYYEGAGWVKNEIRIVRNLPGVKPWNPGANSFRINGRKMRVIELDAYIYHYGWARDPDVLLPKIKEHRKWHEDKEPSSLGEIINFKKIKNLNFFKGKHPEVMLDKVKNAKNLIEVKKEYLKKSFDFYLRELFAVFSWAITGRRMGEYENFVRIGRWKKFGKH